MEESSNGQYTDNMDAIWLAMEFWNTPFCCEFNSISYKYTFLYNYFLIMNIYLRRLTL